MARGAVLAGDALVLFGLGLGAYFLFRNATVKSVSQSVGQTAGAAAGGLAVGTVLGVGQGLGIPLTSPSQCTQDMAAGHTWDASFSCSAPTFLSYLFGGKAAPSANAPPSAPMVTNGSDLASQAGGGVSPWNLTATDG